MKIVLLVTKAMDLNNFEIYPKPNSDEFTDFINHFVPEHKSRSAQKNKLRKDFDQQSKTPTVRSFLMYLYFTRLIQHADRPVPPAAPPMPPVLKDPVELSPQEKGYNKFINSIAYKKISSIQPDYVSGYLQDYKDGIDLDWDDIQIKINTYFKKRFPV